MKVLIFYLYYQFLTFLSRSLSLSFSLSLSIYLPIFLFAYRSIDGPVGVDAELEAVEDAGDGHQLCPLHHHKLKPQRG